MIITYIKNYEKVPLLTEDQRGEAMATYPGHVNNDRKHNCALNAQRPGSTMRSSDPICRTGNAAAADVEQPILGGDTTKAFFIVHKLGTVLR